MSVTGSWGTVKPGGQGGCRAYCAGFPGFLGQFAGREVFAPPCHLRRCGVELCAMALACITCWFDPAVALAEGPTSTLMASSMSTLPTSGIVWPYSPGRGRSLKKTAVESSEWTESRGLLAVVRLEDRGARPRRRFSRRRPHRPVHDQRRRANCARVRSLRRRDLQTSRS